MKTEDTIRSLTLAETETLIGWAQDEGWNPGLADAAAFHATDPQGFIGCFSEDRLAAGISAVRYGSDFGFIGLYIAHPDFRGRGLGRKVWDAGMRHLEGRTIGLDGVPEQQANYAAMGFKPAYETFRWSGRMDGRRDAGIMPAGPEALPAIAAYDRHVFPAERLAFLAEWLKPPRAGRAIIRDGAIRGYAVARRCHDGFKIGPLFADSVEEAERLIKACAADAGGETLHIDVPVLQHAFSARLSKLGFSKGFTTARMYRGPAPALASESVFGVTTLELG